MMIFELPGMIVFWVSCYALSLMLQEYLSLGTMQRRHFSLEQINSAVDFMQTLTCTGKPFMEHGVLTLWTDIHCLRNRLTGIALSATVYLTAA